jgi:hypothetical protein
MIDKCVELFHREHIGQTLNEAVEILKGATGYTGTVKFASECCGDVKHSLGDISQAKGRFGYELFVQCRSA